MRGSPARRGLQLGTPVRAGSQTRVVEQPEASRDLALGPCGEPVVGHDAELRLAIALGQRLAERQAQPRPGRAERVGHDHRDGVGVPARGPGVELLDGEARHAAAELVEALLEDLAERGDRRVGLAHAQVISIIFSRTA